MIFWRPESDARREVSADRFLESHFWPMDGLVMSEILFFCGNRKNKLCMFGWLVVGGGWWMVDEKMCFGKLVFGTKTCPPGTSTRGGAGLDDTDQRN